MDSITDPVWIDVPNSYAKVIRSFGGTVRFDPIRGWECRIQQTIDYSDSLVQPDILFHIDPMAKYHKRLDRLDRLQVKLEGIRDMLQLIDLRLANHLVNPKSRCPQCHRRLGSMSFLEWLMPSCFEPR